MILPAESFNVSGAQKKEHPELDQAVFSWRLLLYHKVRGLVTNNQTPHV